MNTAKRLPVRRALVAFVLAMAGSISGTLAAPRIAGVFAGAPAWMLPAVSAALALLALLAAYLAFRLAMARKRQSTHDSSGQA